MPKQDLAFDTARLIVEARKALEAGRLAARNALALLQRAEQVEESTRASLVARADLAAEAKNALERAREASPWPR